jgi:hypothetical protein
MTEAQVNITQAISSMTEASANIKEVISLMTYAPVNILIYEQMFY